jgi:hypothetical protein
MPSSASPLGWQLATASDTINLVDASLYTTLTVNLFLASKRTSGRSPRPSRLWHSLCNARWVST